MVVFELQRQYNLRNRDVNINKEKATAENPSTSQPKRILQKKPLQEKVDDKKQSEVKDSQENRKEITTEDTDKTQSAFSLENELSKIKIPIPFGELLKNSQYKGQIAKMLRAEHENVDVLNLSDDHSLIMFGPMVEEQKKEDE